MYFLYTSTDNKIKSIQYISSYKQYLMIFYEYFQFFIVERHPN